jgi:hypothetical protein
VTHPKRCARSEVPTAVLEGGWGSPAEAGEARGSGRASLQLATLVAAGARELAKVSEPSLPSRKLTERRLAADEGNWLSEIKPSPAVSRGRAPHDGRRMAGI